VDAELIRAKARDAARADRKREIHNLHAGYEDNLQRMLNALQPGTYIRPHRHQNPPKAESVALLQGMLACVVFDKDGAVAEDGLALLDLDRGLVVFDSRAGIWHTFFPLAADTVVFECKPGPYEATSDKDFASWAPVEGSPEALEYLAELEDRFRSHWGLTARSWKPGAT